MAFGDNGKRKKTAFEILVQFVVLLMIFITLGGVIFSAINILSR
ncbi:DUF4044 domain-containing protein [Streptococcus plurextorum]|nr:DUF4044 domain-containing protein [Streptococcus plurextorum]